MKVIVTGTRGFPDVQGGVEKHCEKLYTHLAQRGCDITVFTRVPYTSPDVRIYKEIKLVPVSCPKNKFLEAIVHTFKCILKAQKMQPDILHLHAIGPTLFTPFARLLGMKVVVTNHGPDYQRKKWNFAAKAFLKLCERSGMKYADRIIAISDNIADDIKIKYDKTAFVLPNGIDVPVISEGKETLEKYNLEKGKYVLAVGRLVPEKGFHDLIEAYDEIAFGDLKLVIVGDADHEDVYSRSLKTLADTSSNVVMTGYLKEGPLQELYSQAALFILPSYYEGLPIVLLEAMSYGVSCIASDIPANRNVPLDKDRYFSAGDKKAIADQIRKYMFQPWDSKDCETQRRVIYERYNWKKVAEETLQVYKDLIS